MKWVEKQPIEYETTSNQFGQSLVDNVKNKEISTWRIRQFYDGNQIKKGQNHWARWWCDKKGMP